MTKLQKRYAELLEEIYYQEAKIKPLRVELAKVYNKLSQKQIDQVQEALSDKGDMQWR